MTREEAIRDIEDCVIPYVGGISLRMAIEALKEKRPHGEWKKTGRTNIYGGFEIECSVCHTTLMVSPNRWEIGENFCDVCGADMRGEQDG